MYFLVKIIQQILDAKDYKKEVINTIVLNNIIKDKMNKEIKINQK